MTAFRGSYRRSHWSQGDLAAMIVLPVFRVGMPEIGPTVMMQPLLWGQWVEPLRQPLR